MFVRASIVTLCLPVTFVLASTVAEACTVPPPDKQMRDAVVIVTGSGEFVGGAGAIAVSQVIKGGHSVSIAARFPVYCEGSLSPDDQRRAGENRARSKKSLKGTFYLSRDPASPSSFLVTVFVPAQEKVAR